MKTIYNLFILTILTSPVSLSAQLVVNSNTLNTSQLVQDVLVDQGTDVSNVTFSGITIQRGFFDGSNSNIGINSGVILATGNIFVATGPNDLVNATQPVDSGCGTSDDPPPFTGPGGLCRPGDADLNSILGGAGETFDAAVLEFDFIPQSDIIRLNYVFASEEYPEYVCFDSNDLFAFLLSGPNPTGGNYNEVNIARLPGTSLPVGINTINSGIPGGTFGCDGADQSLDFTSLYNNNNFGTTVQFDGFTDKLEAFANVVPFETYHIKIAIADAGDGVLDSAIFLEENSFTTDIVDIIETPEYLTNLDISPNPSTRKFTIDLQFKIVQTATIQVLNALGQQMYQFTGTQSNFEQTIDMQEAAAGTYFVVIRTESGRVVKRVVLM